MRMIYRTLEYPQTQRMVGRSSEIRMSFQGIFAGDTGSPEFSDEPILGVELSRPSNRVRPPKMIALDSTAESITWMLSELDPKINIDKYQVSYHVKYMY